MPQDYTVIATGPPPPSRAAMAGAAFGQGLGLGFGALLGQRIGERRLARDLNPLRVALMQSIPYGGPMASAQNMDAFAQLTPQQQMIATAARDPRLFAQLAGSPAGALELAGVMTPPQAAPPPQRVRELVVHADDPINEQLGIGLKAGESATVKFTYDAQDQLQGFSIEQYRSARENLGDADESTMFGTGLRGRSWEYVTSFAPAFAEGKTTPEQDRVFLSSVTNLRTPETYTDPDTGLLVTRRGELPDFVIRALQARGYSLGDEGIHPPLGGDPAQLARQPTLEQQNQHAALTQAMPTVPPDAMPNPATIGRESIYELIGSGNVMGPVAAGARLLHRIPLTPFGEFFEQTEAAAEVAGIKERIVKGLQQNPRYAEGEAQRLAANIKIEPSAFRSASSAQSQLVGLDNLLARVEDEMQQVVGGKRALVSGETRQHAMDTLQFVRYWRDVLIPPRVPAAQLEQFARTAVPGKKVLIEYSPENRVVAHVFNDEQRANAFAETAPPGTHVVVNGVLYKVE